MLHRWLRSRMAVDFDSDHSGQTFSFDIRVFDIK